MSAPLPPTYLINLDRSTQRLAAATAAFNAVGVAFERIAGVDGRAEGGIRHPAYRREARLAAFGSDLPPGAIGCYLSHIKAMQIGIAAGHARFVIVEDDVVPGPTYPDAMAALARLPEAFGFVRLYGIKKRPSLDLGAIGGGLRLSMLLQGPSGTQGYAVTRAAAQAFLARFSNVFHPIDTQLDRMWDWCGRGFMIEPFVIQEVPDLSANSASAAVSATGGVQDGFVSEASRTPAMKRKLLLRKWGDDALRVSAAAQSYLAAGQLRTALANAMD